MNNFGIIVAENEECKAIIDVLEKINIKKIYDLEFVLGIINNVNIVLVKSGVGKVNAARTTQILIDNFDIDFILNDELDIGDVIVASRVVQHDFDVTAFGREKGFIPDVGKYFICNEVFVNKLINLNIANIKLKSGVVASGDQFILDVKVKDNIVSEFGADCVEMEGAAVAQVCYMSNKPFCIIRSISDKPNGNNHIDFNEFLKLASKNCAKIVYELSKNM